MECCFVNEVQSCFSNVSVSSIHKKLFCQRKKLDLEEYFITFSQPAWFVWNDGSSDSDILSHIIDNMAWFVFMMAWLQISLVQFQFFWTSIALTFATWQHFNKGYCCLLQEQQLSYMVLDNFLLKYYTFNIKYTSSNTNVLF
jgi:hypothetical protein